jgi:L-alanine-DL-glutamate epimerase-like enolase superfamily enzyme
MRAAWPRPCRRWPVILGADPVGPEALMARADAWLPGHVYAKSALDIALWDLTGRRRACRCTRCWAVGAGRPAALSLDHLRRAGGDGAHRARGAGSKA